MPTLKNIPLQTLMALQRKKKLVFFLVKKAPECFVALIKKKIHKSLDISLGLQNKNYDMAVSFPFSFHFFSCWS